jgi:hypothetical protein
MRVISNAKIEKHQVVGAKMELMGTKSIEMFCESIPGESECVLFEFATPP